MSDNANDTNIGQASSGVDHTIRPGSTRSVASYAEPETSDEEEGEGKEKEGSEEGGTDLPANISDSETFLAFSRGDTLPDIWPDATEAPPGTGAAGVWAADPDTSKSPSGPRTSTLDTSDTAGINFSIEAEQWYRKKILSKNWLTTLSCQLSGDLDAMGRRRPLTMTKKFLSNVLLSCREENCRYHRTSLLEQANLDDLVLLARQPTYDGIESNVKSQGLFFCDTHLADRRRTDPASIPATRLKCITPCGQTYTVVKSKHLEDATDYGQLVNLTREGVRKARLTYKCDAPTVIWQEQLPNGSWVDRVPYPYLNRNRVEFSHCGPLHWMTHRWQEPHARKGTVPLQQAWEDDRSYGAPFEEGIGSAEPESGPRLFGNGSDAPDRIVRASASRP
ncbi:hypothetical protein IAT40_007959 [Kwoniella sp. CBS 6097]